MTHSEKMLHALDQEDLVQAQAELSQALKQDKTDILEALGDELLSMGFLDESHQVFEMLKKREPNNLGHNLPLAEIAIENDQIEKAFELLETIPKEDERYPETLLLMADLYQVQGIPEVSESKLLEASRLLPDEPLIQFALAELYFSLDRFVEAQDIYQRLMTEGIDTISGISLTERIGSTLTMQGKFEEAVVVLETALKNDASDDLLFQLALVYRQLKENDKTIAYLKQLREQNPHYVALYLELAECLQEEEAVEEAQIVIEEGIKEDPYHVDFYHFASENTYRLHDPKKAEEFLQTALELGESEEKTLLLLSDLYLNEGRYEAAIACLDTPEVLENPYAMWNMAHAYNELEDYERAGQYYEEANDALSHEPDFMKEYGIFLREEGRLEEASELLSHYLAHEPGDMEVQSILEDLRER